MKFTDQEDWNPVEMSINLELKMGITIKDWVPNYLKNI